MMKPLSVVTFRAVGRKKLDFSTQRIEQVRVGAGLGGGGLAC